MSIPLFCIIRIVGELLINSSSKNLNCRILFSTISSYKVVIIDIWIQDGQVFWYCSHQREPRLCFIELLRSFTNSSKSNASLCFNFWTHSSISTSFNFTPIDFNIDFNLSKGTRPSSPTYFLKILPTSTTFFWTKTHTLDALESAILLLLH